VHVLVPGTKESLALDWIRKSYQKGTPMSDFVICINNESNPASLIVGKVYRTLSDAEAEAHNMLRVIDEDKSEPDGYLYPASMFASIELPEVVKQALTAAGT
jgi:hypothetical protein